MTQNPPQKKVSQLIKYYQEASYENAEKLAKSITEYFPNHILSLKILGVVLQKLGKVSEALKPMKQFSIFGFNLQ